MANHRWIDNTCCRCGVVRTSVVRKAATVLGKDTWWRNVPGFSYSSSGNGSRPECISVSGKKTVFRVENYENNI